MIVLIKVPVSCGGTPFGGYGDIRYGRVDQVRRHVTDAPVVDVRVVRGTRVKLMESVVRPWQRGACAALIRIRPGPVQADLIRSPVIQPSRRKVGVNVPVEGAGAGRSRGCRE